MGSKEVNEIIDFLKKNTPLPGTPIEQLRSDFENFYSQFTTHQNYRTEEVKIDHLSGLWITASNVKKKGTILFFHGGGFTIGSVQSHLDLCARLSACSSMKVLGINYRKAPEYPYPSPIEDCLTVYQWLVTQEAPIFLAGISAGATLVLSTLILIKEKSLKLPLATICMCPLVDFTLKNKSLDTNANKDWIYKERLESVRSIYLNEEDPTNPLASPIFANFKGFPPLLIQVGKNEILLDDSYHLAKKAKEQGVSVTLEVWDDMIHCWHIFASKIPEGVKAVENIGKYISEIC